MKWKYVPFIIIAAILGFLFVRQTNPQNNNEVTNIESYPTLSPEEINEIKEDLEQKTSTKIPTDQNTEQTVLRAVEIENGSGIATKNFTDNQYILTVIADLPKPANEQFYQAWLEVPNNELPAQKIGKLASQKGGWIIQYNSNNELNEYQKIRVTLEQQADDNPEITVLEGTF